MNPSFTILAKEDKVRHVLRCAQGLIHLTWGSATLHLPDRAFNGLADFLHCAQRQLRPCQYWGNAQHIVMQCARGHCQTWLHGLGLHLPRAEFDRLALLVEQAQVCLATQSKPAPLPMPAQGFNCITYAQLDGQGVVQVHWRQTTLCFTRIHFSGVIDFLRLARERQEWRHEHADGKHWLVRDEQGYYQLWLRGMGVYLSAAELGQFDQLCEQAFVRLESDITEVQRWGSDKFRPAAPSFSFSLN